VRRGLAAAALVAAAPSTAAAKAGGQPDLWGTVNLCDTPAQPGAVGVRVSIPREQGAPAQRARIRLQSFDGDARAWRLVRSGGDAGWARIRRRPSPRAGGTTFTFLPPKAGSRIVLRGLVDVEWRRGRRIVDHARLQTTAGHDDAGDRPLRVSRSSCEIKR
jgi:hypothetical protein